MNSVFLFFWYQKASFGPCSQNNEKVIHKIKKPFACERGQLSWRVGKLPQGQSH